MIRLSREIDPLGRKVLRILPQSEQSTAFRGVVETTSCEGKAIPMLWGKAILPGNVIFLPDEGVMAGAPYTGTAILAVSSTLLALLGYDGIWHNGEKLYPPYDLFAFGGGHQERGDQTTAWSYLTTSTTATYSEQHQIPDAAPNYVIDVALKANFTTDVGVEYYKSIIEGWQALTPSTHYTVASGTYTITTSLARAHMVRITYTATAAPFGGIYDLSYQGTAYFAHSGLNLGNDPPGKVGDWKFSVPQGEPVQSGGKDANGDISPALIARDILTGDMNGQSCELELARIDAASWEGWRQMCGAHDLFMSIALLEQRGADEILADLFLATNSQPLWSDGVLKVVPLDHRSASSTVLGNAFTYSPDLEPVAEIGLADLVVESASDDPVRMESIPLIDTFNAWPIEYLARDKTTAKGETPPATTQLEDWADADETGLRTASVTTAHCYLTESRAQWLSRALATRSVRIRCRYRFALTWRHLLLEPGDLVSLTDGACLDGKVVRITAIEEAEELGRLDVEAEDVPWPTG